MIDDIIEKDIENIDIKELKKELDELLCHRLKLCEEIAQKMWYYSI